MNWASSKMGVMKNIQLIVIQIKIRTKQFMPPSQTSVREQMYGGGEEIASNATKINVTIPRGEAV
jgi:hypothetical protein